MADAQAISWADLRAIENNLNAIHHNLDVLNNDLGTVNNNVATVYKELGSLAEEFHDFVSVQVRANRLGQAETRLVKIRQELEKRFGHYDLVRRTTTGILQADDIGLVKKETISNATEEMMISTPGYWLAPCLVALAAWINDQPELADKALREAIKRNDEKTSLFWALVCRRANRKQASLKWTQRYLENQDEANLNRNTVIILDAYASGLLGADSEGVISRQMDEWLDHLEDQPGFVDQQTKQWSDAINQKRKPLPDNIYPYLRKYSKTWPQLADILEGAYLHADILSYFVTIFEQEGSTAAIREQLDDILSSLVTDFDDEELPLRKEEKFEQFIVDFGGDEKRASQNMQIEQTAFEEKKDFTQLLTDAAMKPQSSHASVSTQKFAIALSRDWITNAYNDVVAQNRMKVPQFISVDLENFHAQTQGGENEPQIIADFHAKVEKEKLEALSKVKLSMFDQFCLFGGIAIAVLGILLIVTHHLILGAIAIIAGAGLVLSHFSKKKNVDTTRKNIEEGFRKKHADGEQILHALIAEIVDFRREFYGRDQESAKVLDFLGQISPDQYVRKLSESNRRIRIG